MAERVTVGAAELAELITASIKAATALQTADAEIKRLRAALRDMAAQRDRAIESRNAAWDRVYAGTGTAKWDLEP